MHAPDALARACQQVGADVLLVQGAGGNISCKEGAVMHIKASGTTLARVTATQGQLPVAYRLVVDHLARIPADAMWSDALERDYLQVIRDARRSDTAMPSLETGFHASMGAAVVHTHPIALNALLCTRDGPALLSQALPGVPIVEYRTVGVVLSRALLPYADTPVVLLRNHGLITQGRTLDEALARTRSTVDAAMQALARAGVPLPQGTEDTQDGVRSQDIAALMRAGIAMDRVPHVFPDSVVYCAYGDAGVRCTPDGAIIAQSRSVAQIAYAHAYLARIADTLGGLVPLPDVEIAILRRMESERYRRAEAAR